jgi:hypothetical protein
MTEKVRTDYHREADDGHRLLGALLGKCF